MQGQNLRKSADMMSSSQNKQPSTGWKGIQGSMVASALMGSVTTNDTAGHDQPGSERQLTQEDGSPRTGQPECYNGLRGQKRRRGLTANLSMRSPATSNRMSQETGKELTCKQAEVHRLTYGKFAKPRIESQAIFGLGGSGSPTSPHAKEQKSQAFASSRFFRGATATQLDKDKYSQFKVMKKGDPPRLGYLFKVKQLPTTEFLKLRHDERLREAEFAAQEPHNQRQLQEFLNLKNANVNTNKDKRVLMVRPHTGTLDTSSVQTQHMATSPQSRGASRSNINTSGTVTRAARGSRNINRMYGNTDVRTSAAQKLSTAKSQTVKNSHGKRMFSTINSSVKKLRTDDLEDDLENFNYRTLSNQGRRTKPHQNMGINVEMKSQGQLTGTSKNKLVDQLFLCKKPADPDYRKTAAGKTNTSQQITAKLKHFQSFKYPPNSPEGKEFQHLSKNPLKLNEYERNYLKTEKKKPRNRYYQKASQDEGFVHGDTVQGMLTQNNNYDSGNYATIQLIDHEGNVQNQTPPPHIDGQNDCQMIYIADPIQAEQMQNAEKQKQDHSRLSNKFNPDMAEYDHESQLDTKNKNVSYDFQGYTNWISRQIDRMVASDNIAYKCRDQKNYIFSQIKDHCKMKYCQQSLNVGGIQTAGPSLGSPLKYMKKKMPQGRYPEKWARMTSASRYFQTKPDTCNSYESSNQVISGVAEVSGLHDNVPRY